MTVATSSPPELMERMAALGVTGQMKIPPPIFLDMDGDIVDINLERHMLIARFPVKERYQNPLGYMQGGMIATAVDNAIGPLSFLVAPPSVTKTMTVNYRRPVTPDLETITVVAQYEGQNGRELTFTAKVLRHDEKVLAEATAIQVIINL